MAQGNTILLVDDEAAFRFAVSRALSLRGYEVVSAESAEEALAHLRSAEVDLVITDIKMPGIDGFELVTWLKANRPDIYVLMTTAYGSMQVREQSMELGALRYLEKPVDLGELADILQATFEQPGWKGAIRDLDLFDYVQLVATTRRDKILQVQSASRAGQIYIQDGQIIHATFGTMEGEDAFFSILSWTSGDVEDLPWHAPESRTIERSTSVLIMEGALQRDLREDRPPSQPPASAAPSPAPEAPPPQASPSWDAPSREGPGAPPSAPLPAVHYEAALKGMDRVAGVDGALLLRKEGAILATRGMMTPELGRIMVPLTEGCLLVGEQLGLGRYDSAVLHLHGGDRVLVEPLGNLLLGVQVQSRADIVEVRAWIREVVEAVG